MKKLELTDKELDLIIQALSTQEKVIDNYFNHRNQMQSELKEIQDLMLKIKLI